MESATAFPRALCVLLSVVVAVAMASLAAADSPLGGDRPAAPTTAVPGHRPLIDPAVLSEISVLEPKPVVGLAPAAEPGKQLTHLPKDVQKSAARVTTGWARLGKLALIAFTCLAVAAFAALLRLARPDPRSL